MQEPSEKVFMQTGRNQARMIYPSILYGITYRYSTLYMIAGVENNNNGGGSELITTLVMGQVVVLVVMKMVSFYWQDCTIIFSFFFSF